MKAVSELFSPINGTVVAVNTELSDHPELVNDAPYDKGWMLVIAPDSPLVAVIMGSKSDLPIMQDAADVLKELGVEFEFQAP